MKYKMIFIDMDGTLLGKNKKISQFNKDIIKKAHDKGVEIVVTTGRLYNNAAYFSNILGVSSPVIAANGAVVINKKTNEIIYEREITKEDCINIYDILTKCKLPFNFHTTNKIYCSNWINRIGTEILMSKQKCFEHLNIEYITVKSRDEWIKVFEKENGSMAKCIALSTNTKKVIEARAKIEKLSNVVTFASGGHSLEINCKGVSKGNAVKVLAKKFGINREEVICIGDNENDISMIEFAGLGIAMGNAIDKVKDAADYITDTNKNNGVGKAIEKFILNIDTTRYG